MFRSPGGTPVREAPKPAESTDPAAIIANALKKKFSHPAFHPSPDRVRTRSPLAGTPSPRGTTEKSTPSRTPVSYADKPLCIDSMCPLYIVLICTEYSKRKMILYMYYSRVL